ncbi:MAG: DUF4153 domain-containing protein [Bacteroidota bacterium]
MVYERYTGLNCLFISLVVQATIHFTEGKNAINKGAYYMCQFLCLCLALSAALYGTDPIMALVWFSWVATKFYAADRANTILPAAVMWGHLLFIENLFIPSPAESAQKTGTEIKGSPLGFMHYFIAFAIVVLFFLIYTSASTGFSLATEGIINIFSYVLIFLVFLGLVIGKGLFSVPPAYTFKGHILEAITLKPDHPFNAVSGTGPRDYARLVNLVLLLIIAMGTLAVFSDAYLLLGTKLSAREMEGTNASMKVHENVGGVVRGVICAVALILFVHSKVNIKENKLTGILLFVFLVVNAGLLLNTAIANFQYVFTYGLTHKRIGVYIFLVITGSGLVITTIYLLQDKALSWLFNMNSFVAYTCLVFYIIMPWDIYIAESQLSQPANMLDIQYINELDDYALPVIMPYSAKLDAAGTPGKRSNHLRNLRHLKYYYKKRSDIRDWRLMDIWAMHELQTQKTKGQI